MAITPTEAKKLMPDEQKIVRRLESLIDAHLREKPPDVIGGHRYEIPSETPDKVVAELMKLYRGTGWTVTRDFGDQREPANALYLKPAHSTGRE